VAVLHQTEPVYVLPAEVFDLLELAAEAHGGIGCGAMYADCEAQEPLCAHGLLEFAKGEGGWNYQPELLAVGLSPGRNDGAFKFKEHQRGQRLSFKEWCRRLGVGRGE